MPTDVNQNTGVGFSALASNTTGANNTATGYAALNANSTGHGNTANGWGALAANTSGFSNTAIGLHALGLNSLGLENTAVGKDALASNSSGSWNAATGVNALQNNSIGHSNSAFGYNTLLGNTTGFGSTAVGLNALVLNTTGYYNTAVGDDALSQNVTGIENIAIGRGAGSATTGSDNILIGHQGSASVNGVIHIGTDPFHTAFFVAGVRGTSTGMSNAVPVLIDSNGQLGTASSSRRFKGDIDDMADASSGLLRLRPVTFRYLKPYADGSKPLDYGLIAEEVAEIYPNLVVRGADGQVETVQYQKLTPMLLNELQKQHQRTVQQEEALKLEQYRNQRQADQIRSLESRVAALEALLASPPPVER